MKQQWVAAKLILKNVSLPFRIIIVSIGTTTDSYGAFVISRIVIKSDALLGTAGVGGFCCGTPAHGVSIF
jgi:hypothetical protein